jgi:putative phosphoesterase
VKLAVITDVHANLPALNAALEAIEQEGYDLLVHTGDLIGIGPFPAECLDALRTKRNIMLVMGNHDAMFAEGLPETRQSNMSEGEWVHQKWTHEQLDSALRSFVSAWPYEQVHDLDGVKIKFLHYGLSESRKSFASIIRQPTAEQLDTLLEPEKATLVFYGHHHPFADHQGKGRYVNPGSLGCNKEPVARYSIMNIQHGQFSIEHRAAPYDDGELFKEFEQRKVPEREFIYRALYGRGP